MIISKSLKFVFIHLEKCGGSSVEIALEPYTKWDDLILGSTDTGEALQSMYKQRFGPQYMKDNMLWKHSDAKNIQEYMGDEWESYFKFATVRNPEKMLRSFYFYCQDRVKQFMQEKYILDINAFIAQQGIPKRWVEDEMYLLEYIVSVFNNSGIDGFIQSLIEKDYPFIAPQTKRLGNSVNMYDLETINYHWPKILDEIGIKNKFVLPLINKSTNKGDAILNQKTIESIRDYYHEDYLLIPKQTGNSWS
jgi:hypothetical protein